MTDATTDHKDVRPDGDTDTDVDADQRGEGYIDFEELREYYNSPSEKPTPSEKHTPFITPRGFNTPVGFGFDAQRIPRTFALTVAKSDRAKELFVASAAGAYSAAPSVTTAEDLADTKGMVFRDGQLHLRVWGLYEDRQADDDHLNWYGAGFLVRYLGAYDSEVADAHDEEGWYFMHRNDLRALMVHLLCDEVYVAADNIGRVSAPSMVDPEDIISEGDDDVSGPADTKYIRRRSRRSVPHPWGVVEYDEDALHKLHSAVADLVRDRVYLSPDEVGGVASLDAPVKRGYPDPLNLRVGD